MLLIKLEIQRKKLNMYFVDSFSQCPKVKMNDSISESNDDDDNDS